MSSELTIIQDKVLKSIFSANLGELDFIKRFGDISAKDRFLIHRYTVLENFINSLRITYPGIWKLIGEECARGVALAYSHKFTNIPSQSKISKFGANFPDHLKKFPSTQHLEYLPDFAKLEWLRSLSHDAKREELVDESDLSKINLEKLESYKVKFNSSVFFMTSKFPLLKIQQLLDDDGHETINLQEEDSYLIVYRVDDKINTAALSQSSWHFLLSLFEGKTLRAAFRKARKMEFYIELEEIFKFILSCKMLTQIYCTNYESRDESRDESTS